MVLGVKVKFLSDLRGIEGVEAGGTGEETPAMDCISRERLSSVAGDASQIFEGTGYEAVIRTVGAQGKEGVQLF
jgi:hypothetical protein